MTSMPNPWTHEPRDLFESVGLAFILFSDAYGLLWQPADTAAITWARCFADEDPGTLLRGAREYVKSEPDPPSPARFREFLKRRADAARRRKSRSVQELALAIECRDRIARLKHEDAWDATTPSEREYLEGWAARAPGNVPINRHRGLDGSTDAAQRHIDELERLNSGRQPPKLPSDDANLGGAQ